MKLIRWGESGRERPGIVDRDGAIRDLGAVCGDITPDTLSPASLAEIGRIPLDSLPLVPNGERLGPCVAGIRKLVCVGLNYREHVAEAGAEVPKEPVIFLKAPTAISGPNDDVLIPRGSHKTDWEVELAVVIGTRARYVDEARAPDHIAGYCVANDISERSFQLERGGQWVKGKSSDTFAPIGPWLVTSDEVADPQNLDLYLDVNGKRYQESSTADMIFPVAQLVSYVSHFMTLEPGDIILTGTPPGVGLGQKPPRFLRPGDSMRLGISGLGEQQLAVAADQR